MSTTTNVSQVKVNIMSQSQYDLATKNPNEFYVISDGNLADDSNVVHLSGVETITGAKKIFGVDAGVTGQQNLLAVISNNTGTTGQWVGRMAVGARNKTFLMGTYNNMCILGAHSWTDAQAGTGAAWEPIYINSDGAQPVYIGGSGNTPNSGYCKIDNATGKTLVNIGTVASPNWLEVNSLPTVQQIYPLTSGSIPLNVGQSIYMIQPTSGITFSFTAPITFSNTAYTFELIIKMPSTVYSMTFPNSLGISWQDGEAPDLSETGTYLLAFRAMSNGAWLGNLQGKW